MTATDFSPAMLRLFLAARCLHRRNLTGDTPGANRRAFLRETGRAASIAQVTVENAMAGHLNAAGKRAALWAALGVFPGDSGVVLTDDGGQGADNG